MPTLVRFLIRNIASGFMIGAVVGAAFVSSQDPSGWLSGDPAAAALLIWAFGASFAMGYVGTALGLFSSDDPSR